MIAHFDFEFEPTDQEHCAYNLPSILPRHFAYRPTFFMNPNHNDSIEDYFLSASIFSSIPSSNLLSLSEVQSTQSFDEEPTISLEQEITPINSTDTHSFHSSLGPMEQTPQQSVHSQQSDFTTTYTTFDDIPIRLKNKIKNIIAEATKSTAFHDTRVDPIYIQIFELIMRTGKDIPLPPAFSSKDLKYNSKRQRTNANENQSIPPVVKKERKSHLAPTRHRTKRQSQLTRLLSQEVRPSGQLHFDPVDQKIIHQSSLEPLDEADANIPPTISINPFLLEYPDESSVILRYRIAFEEILSV